jgi:YidC/Oxa1 family membrane protein insertase
MQQQKILLYVFPLMFAVFGVNFPIGVLLYWLTTNLWTAGQQYYVIRRNPAPGSPAYEALQERRKAKEKARQPAGEGVDGTGTDGPVEPPRKAQRQQPKRSTRAQRRGATKDEADGDAESDQPAP